MPAVTDPREREPLPRFCHGIPTSHAAEHQRECHVLVRGKLRQQLAVLKDEPEPRAPERATASLVRLAYVPAIEGD